MALVIGVSMFPGRVRGQVQPPYRHGFDGAGLPDDSFWTFQEATLGRIRLEPGTKVDIPDDGGVDGSEPGPGLRAAMLTIDNPVVLAAQDFYLERPNLAEVQFFVYEAADDTGPFTRIWSSSVTANPGNGYVPSGPMNVLLEAGHTYVIGVASADPVTFRFAADELTGQNTFFGTTPGGVARSDVSAPATLSTISLTETAYVQRLRFNTPDELPRGGHGYQTSGGEDVVRGNFIECTSDRTLSFLSVDLDRAEEMDVTFSVYQASSLNGTYSRIASNTVTAAAGAHSVRSGRLDAELQAGKFYLVRAAWDGPATYKFQNDPHPTSLPFGSVVGGYRAAGTTSPIALVSPSVEQEGYRQFLMIDHYGAVRMDLRQSSSSAHANDMRLALDMTGYEGAEVEVRYQHRSAGEELHDEGLYISGDETTWHQIHALPTGTTPWTPFTADLVQAMSDFGIAFDDNVTLRWRQADTDPWNADGREFRDIVISAPPDLELLDFETPPSPLFLRGTDQANEIEVVSEVLLHAGAGQSGNALFRVAHEITPLGTSTPAPGSLSEDRIDARVQQTPRDVYASPYDSRRNPADPQRLRAVDGA